MTESLLVAGIVCIVASIVGGGVRLLGAEVPVLNSFARQAMLFAVGAAFLGGSFLVGGPKPAPSPAPSPAPASNSAAQPASQASTAGPAGQSPSPQAPAPPVFSAAPAGPGPSTSQAPAASAQCPPATALTCLPKSSGAVEFANLAAANAAASANIRSGFSTSEAEAIAIRGGASGKAARLCGIIGSNDSSPLGKHNAAVRLNNPLPTDGQATDSCVNFADNFL